MIGIGGWSPEMSNFCQIVGKFRDSLDNNQQKNAQKF